MEQVSHMEYLEEMEQIDSTVMEQVIEAMESYDYSKYTRQDVEAALSHDSCSIEDFGALQPRIM